MTRDEFKILHSELIKCCQSIEFDLKRIYSGMSDGDFEDTMDTLETSSLGQTLRELKKLDSSDGTLDIKESSYELLDDIREIRNYWCHQCYIDYIYIADDQEREKEFQRIARRLFNEHNRLYNIHRRLEKLYIEEYNP